MLFELFVPPTKFFWFIKIILEGNRIGYDRIIYLMIYFIEVIAQSSEPVEAHVKNAWQYNKIT